MDAKWFEMKEVRRRRIGDAVWIPLRIEETLVEERKYGELGYRCEFFGLGSLAVPLAKREQAQALRWHEIGIVHDHGIWASADSYKPVDVYQHNPGEDLGFELALIQRISGPEPRQWHLNQDLVFALGLLREGDVWVKPDEDYTSVARLRRKLNGEPIALEVKNEFLRDYLCARGLFLKLSFYRSRQQIVSDPSLVGSPNEQREEADQERFELRITPILEGGAMEGSYAVVHVGRTDVDPDEDVPVPGPETPSNTESKSWTGMRQGKRCFRIEGELWRDEELEPAQHSIRVRRDRVPTGVSYIVDASGARASSEELDNEDIGRWLWFRPAIISELLKHRGSDFKWYTRETGGVGCGPGSLTHFGVNAAGLVTVYAFDVARLELWKQRIWCGHNVSPEGGVSKELLSAQMRAVVADTFAPEAKLQELLHGIDSLFIRAIGSPLFRPHSESENLHALINRFRAIDQNGLFALAKDMMRIVADRIDIGALQKKAPPPPKEKWGSLKSLEKYLSTLVSAGEAYKVMGPLFGIYQLRIADAHLAPKDLDEAFALSGIDPNLAPLEQGFQLVESAAKAVWTIGSIVHSHIEGSKPSSS